MSSNRRNLAVLAATLATAIMPEVGASSDFVNDTYPWVNVNRHFGASIRTGRVVPVTPNAAWGMSLADGGVYLYGADVSGWAASADGGHTFDNANSGRLFSNNICGGYPASWYDPQYEKDTHEVCSANPNALRPFAEGGPPTALAGFTGTVSQTNAASSGPAPQALADPAVQALCRGPSGQSGCAGDVIYTANNVKSFFSPDAGRQWFPLTPQCEMKAMVAFASIASDRGKPGHVVALAADYQGDKQFEASGCQVGDPTKAQPTCSIRTIAYTQDVGEELKESILATDLKFGNTASNGRMRTERAGGGGADPDATLPAGAGGDASGGDSTAGAAVDLRCLGRQVKVAVRDDQQPPGAEKRWGQLQDQCWGHSGRWCRRHGGRQRLSGTRRSSLSRPEVLGVQTEQHTRRPQRLVSGPFKARLPMRHRIERTLPLPHPNPPRDRPSQRLGVPLDRRRPPRFPRRRRQVDPPGRRPRQQPCRYWGSWRQALHASLPRLCRRHPHGGK